MRAAQRHLRAPSRLWPFGGRDDIITVLDLGAQKVACAIVSLASPRFGLDVGAKSIRILGSAAVRSSGFSGGRIVNLVAMETSIRRAVAQAEAQAGITVEDVLVTGPFLGLNAQTFEAKLGDGNTLISKEDMSAIERAAEEECYSAHRKLLHLYTAPGEIENEDGNLVPGREIEVVAVSMPLRGARQIAACLAKSLLTSHGYIAGPVAASLSVTTPLERSAGILVIDMGASSTGYALFSRGIPFAVECIPIGGHHISDDLARTFKLRKFEAERLKVRYGSVHDGLQADIDLPVANGETREPISKFSLNHLIRSNASRIFTAINERLKGAGYSVPVGGAVLAGGGSLLPGVCELASYLLASEVKVAKPVALNGLNGGPAMSALMGACLYASRHQWLGEMRHMPGIASQDSSYASRISQWLRASF